MGVIYRLLFPSGKSYIGQTKQQAHDRWKAHKHNAHAVGDGGCRAVNAAIRKYGWVNVRKSVLCTVNDTELDACEIALIAKYDSYHNGYNLSEGGDRNPMERPECRDRVCATCRTAEHRTRKSGMMRAKHADPTYHARWATSMNAARATPEHRAIVSTQSRRVWDNMTDTRRQQRAQAISAALQRPDIKAKRSKPRTAEARASFQAKLRATWARKMEARRLAAHPGSQYACAAPQSPSLSSEPVLKPVWD
jgi:hypothetical protein